MNKSLYSFYVDKEYKDYVNDLSKALVIIFTMQLLIWLNSNTAISMKIFNLFSIYLIFGITVYYLIFTGLVSFI